MHRGYIKLWRKIQDSSLWKAKRVFSKAEAWIDILMEMRHSDKTDEVLIGNKMITCKQYQCIKSLDTWAERWGWTDKYAVRRFLILLSDMGKIKTENVIKTTRITVLNAGIYNNSCNASATDLQQTCNASATDLQPDKNVKNEKNVKKEKNKRVLFQKPSVHDIEEYCKNKNLQYVNAQKFIDYYESNGWMVGKNKMKSWPHAVSGWNTREMEKRGITTGPTNGDDEAEIKKLLPLYKGRHQSGETLKDWELEFINKHYSHLTTEWDQEKQNQLF